ncbi:MAG: hypothetical protein C5B48_13610 [Candidatus Rokuibacteriota bacterium]|nr:MAG: hypothetical protein C5B48_13610 [Candidatus Rokubacteria bacterium]
MREYVVSVEIYSEPVDGAEPVRQALEAVEEIPGRANAYLSRGRIPGSSRPAWHCTSRIVAHHGEAREPIEAPVIRWCDETPRTSSGAPRATAGVS